MKKIYKNYAIFALFLHCKFKSCKNWDNEIIDNQHLKNKIVKNCKTVYDKITHEVNKISGQGRTLTIASCL